MDYRTLLQPRMAKVSQDAGLLRRLGSLLIDLLLLDLLITAPFTPLFSRIVGEASVSAAWGAVYTGREMAAVIIIFLLIYVYYVLFEYLLGQTIGMMVMGTRVSGEIGVWRLLVRNSFILPFFPFIILWVIEPVSILLRKRSTMEMITETRTLHQRQIIL